ncbi:hypothetical protein GGQ80_000796 [Sphingomonas jinjuensis]|uniref:Uncharacterized protein n=1 Tax=Sphingomonas jinjuensis TaxID=535907 RepID=A0A840FFY4_9SPHN|nr:hypothetical protein [Sphingomonas jinjuensis]MBB4152908.1 hypothetical protein [Sphingomonas jinjuensis]
MKIRMLVGQEGPATSRVRGQLLEVGVDVDAAEAERLVEATFAEAVDEQPAPPAPKVVKPKPARPAA